ncbi:MAG: hypothetical protein M1837_005518 [Sclerophora amabilis]|nr:MAG: hypothetical protein M1837_005518 [Sclerophora amabilis]
MVRRDEALTVSIDQKELDLCLKVLGRAAQYEESLSKQSAHAGEEDAAVHSKLSVEYFVVRTALAWRQDRLDLAEHMFTKAALSKRELDAGTAESLADLLYEMGKSLLAGKQHDSASKWLQRAYDILMGQDQEKLSLEAGELRLSIAHAYVKALIAINREDTLQKARDLVSLLEQDFGDKLVILLLRLDILIFIPTFDALDYYSVFLRMIRTVSVTDATFRIPELAAKALEEILLSRLLASEQPEWIEQALITRIWMSTSDVDHADNLESLRKVLDSLSKNLTKPLSASATHAAQILLWKNIESHHNQSHWDITISWCQLALHTLFANAGDLNQGKITRKIISCAISKHDITAAREAFEHMSDQSKRAPLTVYLMFKAAVRDGDAELTTKYLDAICIEESKDANLLYACVLEAQESGDKLLASATLQRVLERCNRETSSEVHLPALIRRPYFGMEAERSRTGILHSASTKLCQFTHRKCAVRLLVPRLGANSSMEQDVVQSLCKIFEDASMHAKRCRKEQAGQSHQHFTVEELNWFSRNSYNLALKWCTEWDPDKTLSLLRSSIKFIDLFPKDMSADDLAELSLRRTFCDFVCASLLIVLARSEDTIETQLQFYLSVRSHASDFQKSLYEHVDRLEGEAKKDLLKKYSALLVYQFEAAVRLESWDDLGSIIEQCTICEDVKCYEPMADIILVSKAPTKTMILNLWKLVSQVVRHPLVGVGKLSRWIRCLFHLSLSGEPRIAEQLLDQVISLHNDSNASGEANSRFHQYPPSEVEYLCTTTFNRAVDHYCAGDDVACKTWAEKALKIASLAVEAANQAAAANSGASHVDTDVGDLKGLYHMLMEKWVGLSWEREGSGLKA